MMIQKAVQQFKHYRGALLLWSALLLTALLWFSATHLRESREAFFQLTQQIQGEAQHHVQSNEVILQAFAELVGPSDLFQQRHFESIVDALIEEHPQIRAVLLFPSLPHEEGEELVEQFRKYQDASFTLSADSAKLDQLSPILFYRSRGEMQHSLIGEDARTIEPLAESIEIPFEQKAISTQAYTIEGKTHYFLIGHARRPLSFGDELFPWYSELHIALLIDPREMVHVSPIVRTSLSLYDPSNDNTELLCDTPLDSNLTTQPSILTKQLQYRARLNSISQPFLLETTTTTPLIQLSAAQMALLLLASLLYLYFTHRRISRELETKRRERNSEKRLLLQTKNRIQMLNAISHDIRTPLTRLQLRTATMLKGEAQKKSISDLKEIESLVENSLNYLRDEERNEEPTLTHINEMLFTIQADMAEQGLLFAIHGEARWPYLCQTLQIKRAIQNLLNNAFRFSDEVEVQLQDNGHNLTIDVLDRGPGVEQELLEKVTHPYYRADDSRNSATGGIGLGLSIVREVTEAHDGNFKLQNREHGGLQATISLPR